MNYKPDWPEARERWAALWAGSDAGQPYLSVTAPNGKAPETLVPPLSSGEQKWLDPDHVVRQMLATFETTWYGGNAYPSHLFMGGWVVQTYGAPPKFSKRTIWIDPLEIDWERPPTFDLDLNDPWCRKVFALYDRALPVAGRDRFMIGHGCFLPPNDLLSLIMGTENFLLGLYERPEWMKQALAKLTDNWVRLQRHYHGVVRAGHDFWYANAGWMIFWAPEPFVSTQSDVSCMLSSDMFDEFVLPELQRMGQEFGPMWFHLDGQGATHHLPSLCTIPSLRVVQFVAEAGGPPNGPAHLNLYRKIQAAGKIVHIGLPPENVAPLVRELDPSLLCMETRCASVREGEELLESARRAA